MRSIMERRSIRKFKEEPIPDSMIRRILEAGRFAPSTGNQQPWKFIVIKSPEIIAEMEKDAARLTKILMFFVDYPNFTGIRKRISKFIAHTFTFRLFSNESTPLSE